MMRCVSNFDLSAGLYRRNGAFFSLLQRRRGTTKWWMRRAFSYCTKYLYTNKENPSERVGSPLELLWQLNSHLLPFLNDKESFATCEWRLGAPPQDPASLSIPLRYMARTCVRARLDRNFSGGVCANIVRLRKKIGRLPSRKLSSKYYLPLRK